MADELSGDRPCGVDLNAHVGHLEDREVPLLQAVPEQLWCRLVVILVLRRGNPGAIRNRVFRFRRDPDQFDAAHPSVFRRPQAYRINTRSSREYQLPLGIQM